MTHRYYAPEPASADGLVELDGNEAHHLSRVMRLAPGACVTLFDGRGGQYQAQVAAVGKRGVRLQVQHRLPERHEPSTAIALAVAMPKGERQRWIIEKLTELGVGKLIPLLTQHSVAQHPDGVPQRWRRTVIEACKQCGRNRLLEIVEPIQWSELLLQTPPAALRLIAHPSPKAPPLIRMLEAQRPPWPAGIVAAIGPEGGWTHHEIEAGLQAGWRLTHLGPHILRIDTAALACAAALVQTAVASFEDALSGAWERK